MLSSARTVRRANLPYSFEDFTAIGCFSDATFVLFVRRGASVAPLKQLLDTTLEFVLCG